MVITNRNISKAIKEVKFMLNKEKRLSLSGSRYKSDPFKLLVSTILSARTKDETTARIVDNLFKTIKCPYDLASINIRTLERLIFASGFYRNKARNLKDMAKVLIIDYDGKVPDTINELVKLPGVGRKTANLIVTSAFHKQGICVDTHVHRIMNRWGYVKTKTPNDTEIALRKKLPKRYWAVINFLLVKFGKTICKPINPRCNECRLNKICQYAVKRH